MPKILCEKCESWIASSWHFEKHNAKCIGEKPWRQKTPKNGTCKFCGKKCEPISLGAHTVSCKLNPNYQKWIEKQSQARRGRKASEEQKSRLSKIITEKVKRGEWHCSFSRSRTHEYKGVKFHGMWEVKYAMFLDRTNVNWRRPTEKFKYSFQGKDRYYTPDFYLPEQNLYIEIKGYKVEKDEAKWSQFPLMLKVLTGKELIELGVLESNEVKIIPA